MWGWLGFVLKDVKTPDTRTSPSAQHNEWPFAKK